MRLLKLIRVAGAVLLGTSATSAGVFIDTASPAVAATCADYEILSARGSGEQADLSESQKYLPINGSGLGAIGLKIFDELRKSSPGPSLESYGVHYPAVPVSEAALLGLDGNLKYNNSVAIGTSDIETELARKDLDCPNKRFVLIGYSQGAEAVNHALNAITPALLAKIDAVVLFGDPEFDPSDSAASESDFDPQYAGLLGAHNQGTPWSEILAAPVYDYCHWGDVICDVARFHTDGTRSVSDIDLARIAQIVVSEGKTSLFANHDPKDYVDKGDVGNAVAQLTQLLSGPPL